MPMPQSSVRIEDRNIQFCNHLSVLIKPTDACNLRCRYCYDQHGDYNVDKLSLENLQRFCQITFPYYDDIGIILHGGEPTVIGVAALKKYIDLIKHYAEEHKVNVSYSMQSNGTLLNEDLVNFLKESQIKIGISFDGLCNDYTRNSTEAFFKSKELLEKYKIDFGVLTVVSGLNYRELIPNYEYMKKNKINMQLNHYTDVDASDKNLIMSADDYIIKMKEFFDYWVNDAECNIRVDPFLRLIRDYLRGHSSLCSYSSCMRHWMCLTPNGDITPCDCPFPSEYIYGNVKNLDDIRDVYKSEAFLNLMKKSNLRRAKCRKECDLYNFCEGGCNYCAMHENGLENNKGFSCKTFYEIFSYVVKQGKTLGFFDDNIDFATVKNPTIAKLLKEVAYKKASANKNVKGENRDISKSS